MAFNAYRAYTGPGGKIVYLSKDDAKNYGLSYQEWRKLPEYIQWDGANIGDLEITRKAIEGSELYQLYTDDDSLGSLALQEAMEHFEDIAPDIVSAISEFATDYKVVYEDQNAEEAQSEDVQSASISEHIRASYEFSQFSRATSRVRFFFSRITDMVFDEDGDRVDKLNGMGLPQLADSKDIFNDILNQLWDIEDLNDLMNRINILAIGDPIYKQIYDRLKEVKNRAYNEKYSASNEALLVQIFNVIKSNRQEFIVSRADVVRQN